VVTQMSGD